MDVSGYRVRQARPDDYEGVVAFTENTWPDRDGGDYIPRIFHDWIEYGDDDAERRKRTVVAETDGEVVGISQAVRVSPYESWLQGMRVHPDHRGRGVSRHLNEACFEWARDRGAVVARFMVFSWNARALGAARKNGFDPATEFRWAHPDPDPDATPDLPVASDPDAAYAYWSGSDARDHLRGLAMDLDESWALSELTRAGLHRAADETAVFAVRDGGTRAASYRVREYERETDDGETERYAEYGVGAWADEAAGDALFDAIRSDAASVGADRTRVLIPETPRHVTGASYFRTGVSDEPDFVLERHV